MKKIPFLKIFKILLVFGLALCALGFFWWSWAKQAVSLQESEKKTFVILKGESTNSIAQRLYQEGLIRSPLIFKIVVYKEMLAGKIQAGSFQLSPSMAPREIGEILTHGTNDIWLTIPEGWRSEEIVQELTQELAGESNQDFTKEIRKFIENEGYLFPDTYLFPKQATSGLIIKAMKDNFARKFHSGLAEEAEKKGLTPEEVVILASLVEREVKHDEDRPLVAGILIKRWQNDWPLQVDATVQYVKANDQQLTTKDQINWWPKVTKDDLEISSPYNTYQYSGLPPTPICNPGLASIEAVIYPQETAYWYYLSDNQGNMHYAATIDEHNQNIAKYLQ